MRVWEVDGGGRRGAGRGKEAEAQLPERVSPEAGRPRDL